MLVGGGSVSVTELLWAVMQWAGEGVGRCELVCRAWRDALQGDAFWRTIYTASGLPRTQPPHVRPSRSSLTLGDNDDDDADADDSDADADC
jgi:hypothetical protein